MPPSGIFGLPSPWGSAVATALCMLLGYLLGSVNTGILVTRAVQRRDIREQGSGNAGMTNVIRTVGKKAGAVTFVGDFLKCVLACLLALAITRLAAGTPFALYTSEARGLLYRVGAACVVGHMYPVFFRFRGGKGVVTASAMMLMTDWRVFLLILGTFLLIFLWRRIISLASVVCAALYPAYVFLLAYFADASGGGLPGPLGIGGDFQPFLCALLVGLLCLWKHRSNIQRLRKGEEKPITAKR